MGTIEILSVFFTIILVSKGSEKLLPRGVPVSQQSLYDPLQDFTCFDGSLRIPFLHVNDDYCDCPDGSDEPGTSACPNGRFYCNNVGYIPQDIPTSRVNDGICDCCDASDEYSKGNCTNVCYLLGAEAKKAAEKEAEIASQGNELRLQMIAAGKQIKHQKQERLATLEAEKIEAARIKEEANRLKETAEAAENAALEVHRNRKAEEKEAEEKMEQETLQQEAREIFDQFNTNDDDVLQLDELNKDYLFDENKDGEVTDSDIKQFFNTVTDITWEVFLGAWPKMKPFFQYDSDQNIPDDKKWEYKSKDIEDEEEESIPEHEAEGENEEEEEKREDLEENKPEDDYDENTQKIIDEANQARSNFENAERSLQDVEREFSRIKDSLEKDYGPEDEFVSLDGQCYSYSDREYTYKLCPFDQVVQMGKSGGSETRLGVWAGWSEDSQYKTMLYDKGQTCWNGPQRSTKVTLICGLETSVVAASEPNKCEYKLTLKTPAACKFPTPTQSSDVHDEF